MGREKNKKMMRKCFFALAACMLCTNAVMAEEGLLTRNGAEMKEETEPETDIATVFLYEVYEDYVEITGYLGTEAEVIIPEEIEGVPVTVIGPGAFENCANLSRIELGSSVIEINAKAFAGCTALTEIHIPYNVERISNNSFEGTELNVVSGRVDSVAPVLADYLGAEYVEEEDSPQRKSETQTETVEEESELQTGTAETGSEVQTEDMETEGVGWTETEAEELSPEVADGFIFPDSDASDLETGELARLPLQVLVYGKYEIYARCGMMFRSSELSGYFNEKSWYFGFIDEESFPENMLSETAKANLQLLDQQIAVSETVYQLDQPGYSYDIVNDYLSGESGGSSAVQEEEKEETEKEETELSETEMPETEVLQTEELEPEVPETEMMQTEVPETEIPQTEIRETEAVRNDNGGLNLDGNSDIEVDIMGDGESGEMTGSSQQMQAPAASEYIFPDVASRYLNKSEVEALSLQAICYAKNEVYARHGRKFLSKELQEYFSSKSWYYGIIEPDEFSDRVFNDFELQNIQLLVSCEQAIRPDGYQLDQPGYDIHAVGTASKYDTVAISGTLSDDQYLQQDYIFADSDVRELSEEEIEGLSFKVVSYAAYELYARRGCIFESQEIQQHFNQKSWYAGRIQQADFSEDLFNPVEKSNLTLLKNRRKELKGN